MYGCFSSLLNSSSFSFSFSSLTLVVHLARKKAKLYAMFACFNQSLIDLSMELITFTLVCSMVPPVAMKSSFTNRLKGLVSSSMCYYSRMKSVPHLMASEKQVTSQLNNRVGGYLCWFERIVGFEKGCEFRRRESIVPIT